MQPPDGADMTVLEILEQLVKIGERLDELDKLRWKASRRHLDSREKTPQRASGAMDWDDSSRGFCP
jgi:hypothetical protein